MDAPLKITREKVDGREATVAWLKDGSVKVIFDDGGVMFAVPAKPDEGKAEPKAE